MNKIFKDDEKRFLKMKLWSGYDDNGVQVVPTSELLKWDMRIDRKGTVWYRQQDKERTVAIWCPACQLKHHLMHLAQQQERRKKDAKRNSGLR
ncbi:hypothetical protein AALA24_13655 [Anaerovoracaceae bacterium 42-11]